MTKFTKLSDLLGQEEKPKGKPIEFIKLLSKSTYNAKYKPKDFDNVVHLGSNSEGDYFMVWDNGNDYQGFYLGHINDGFIEQ